MAKKKKTKDQPEKVVEPTQVIIGAFVNCQRVKQNMFEGWFAIKLSAITTLVPVEAENECLFYTYKDCCYHVSISLRDLRRAINSFIFEPESHWETHN